MNPGPPRPERGALPTALHPETAGLKILQLYGQASSINLSGVRRALEILNSFINYERIGTVPRDLDRFREFLRSLGSPHEKLKRVVHIVGTKGKGSTAYHLSHALVRLGFRVGTFTSPHLVDVRERIMLNLRPISGEEFERYFFRIYEKMENPRKSYRTYFETLTAMAILYFHEKGVDFAVFEAGLGGRLDATNVFPHTTTLITRIDYDHTHILGNTLGKIALEKASVIREGSRVLSVPQDKEAIKVIKGMVRRRGASLRIVSPERVEGISLDGTRFVYGGRSLRTPAVGRFQAYNASLSLAVLESYGIDWKEDIFDGLSVPGRFQVIHYGGKFLVLDVAHNAISLGSVVETVKEVFPERRYTAVISIVRDKSIEGIPSIFSGWRIIATRSSSPRSLPPGELCRQFSRCVSVEDPIEALRTALNDEAEVILITGSTYLVGDVLSNSIWR